MKQKVIITLGIVLLLSVIGLMVRDFYYNPEDEGNPYEYNLDDLKKIDSKEICYRPAGQITPEMTGAYAIAIDSQDRIFVGGENELMIFGNDGKVLNSFQIPEKATCLAVHPDGEIYVGMKSHVEVYDPQGALIML